MKFGWYPSPFCGIMVRRIHRNTLQSLRRMNMLQIWGIWLTDSSNDDQSGHLWSVFEKVQPAVPSSLEKKKTWDWARDKWWRSLTFFDCKWELRKTWQNDISQRLSLCLCIVRDDPVKVLKRRDVYVAIAGARTAVTELVGTSK